MLVQNNQKITNQNFINFAGKRLPHQSFEEFVKFAHQTDLLSHVADIFQPNNFVAAGKVNRVYRIPKNDDFLVRVLRNISIEKELSAPLDIKKYKDIFPLNNLGQKIATIGQGISVIIKQQGEVLGIKKWYETNDNKLFHPEYLPEFLHKLNMVSALNQGAYDTMAQEVKLIGAKKHFFDYYTPQNVLVDTKNQAINIVDVEPQSRSHWLFPAITSRAILASFLDKNNFLMAYNLADDVQKAKMKNCAKTVRDKVKIAAKNAALPSEDLGLRLKLKISDLRRNADSLGRYDKFRNFVDSL